MLVIVNFLADGYSSEVKSSRELFAKCWIHFPVLRINWSSIKLHHNVIIIAAHACALQQEYGDITAKTVLDLGCGCGTLAVGSLAGCSKSNGVDIDMEAVDTAIAKAMQFELAEVIVAPPGCIGNQTCQCW